MGWIPYNHWKVPCLYLVLRAVVPTGIAALFYSQQIKSLYFGALVIRQVRLFDPYILDKPGKGGPGCRSPPSDFDWP